MKKKSAIIYALCFCLIATQISYGQNFDSKAKEILDKSRLAIYSTVANLPINTLSMEIDTVRNTYFKDEASESSGVVNLYFESPNRMRLDIFSDYKSNQFLSKRILVNDNFSDSSDTIVNGRSMTSALNIAEIKQTQKIEIFKGVFFNYFFPLTLDYSIYQKLNFKFVGELDLEGRKVFVIDVNGETKTKHRFYFDQGNYLLQMVIEKYEDVRTKEIVERKYVYSDYQVKSGLLVAQKIKVQIAKSMDEEQKVIKLKINSNLDSKLFEIKQR